MRLRVAAALAALAATVAGCGDGDDDGAQNLEGPPPKVELSGCEGKPEISDEFRCGTIEVPKYRSDPERGSLEIGFAVRPRDDRDSPSEGALFAAEGGPGYASTGSANAYVRLFGPLLENRELVLMDMRGTGRSGAIRCPDVQRGTAPQWLALAECGRRLGEDREAYATGPAAEDMDAIRAALGLDRISLYGDSYGTYLAQAYAFRHGDRLDALVLDGAYPVAGESPWYPSLIATGIEGMDTSCRRSPNCTGDAGERLARAAEYMRRNRMNVGKLIDAVAGGSYDPPQSYVAVDRAITKLLAGRPRAWRRLTLQETTGLADRYSYSYPAELVFSCNDYPMIWDRDASEEERRVQLERAVRAYDEDAFGPFTPREVALATDVGYLECLTWPQPTELREPPVRPGMEPTEAPVLVVNGELDDLTTPFEGGLVADFFPNSKRFVERNAGHVAALYYSDGPSARTIRRFLREVYADEG